jgi:hypothetical protein
VIRNLARETAASPEVREAAAYLSNPITLESWLRDVWHIVPDPLEAEFIRSPRFLLQCGRFEGDCDDASALASAILLSMGVPLLLVAIRTRLDTEFSHVFVHVPALGLDIDPIVPVHQLPLVYDEAMILEV